MGSRVAFLDRYGDEFVRSILDALPDAVIVVAATGEIVFANGQAGAVFGSVDALVGGSVDDLLPSGLQAMHRANRTRYRAQGAVRPMGAGLDLWARRLDGASFPVEINLSPLKLGDELFTVASVRDITLRAEDKDELQRVLRTLDASDEAVFIVDAATLGFFYVNDGAVRLVRYRKDELLSMTPLHLDPSTTRAEYLTLIESLVADPTSSVLMESVLLGKDGLEVPVEMTLRSAPGGRDGITSVLILARDISLRQETKRALVDSQTALQQAEQVLAVTEDRKRIARDIHDTVIQRLFGEGLNLQAALLSLADPVRTRERLQSTMNGLDETIKDLRMMIFALQDDDATAPGGLRRQLMRLVNGATESSGLDLRVEFDGPIETILDSIAEQLVPVLREALSNIVRHASARAAHVVIAAGADAVTLTVTDDGVGPPPAITSGGRGLGNMSARAEGLGGTSAITAQSGGGSVLVWAVPARARADR